MGSARRPGLTWGALVGTGLFALLAPGGFGCGDEFSSSSPGAGGGSPDAGGARGGSSGRGSGGTAGGGSAGTAGRAGSSGSAGRGGASGAGASGGSTSGASGSGGSSGAQGSNGSSGAQGAGGSEDAGPQPCGEPGDCPAPTSPCELAACLQRVCSVIPLAPGIEPMQTRGDCLRHSCEGGNAQTFADPTDSDDGNECTTDACNGTVASHVPRTGQTCSAGFCTSEARCLRCLIPAHCGPPSSECAAYKCENGECHLGPAPAGTLCNALQDQCNGAGACVDCVNSGGCGECCTCGPNNTCIPA
jgi:hypothetical protein